MTLLPAASPPTATTLPPIVGRVAARVDAHLSLLLDEERRRWTDVDGDLEAPLDALAQAVLGGGKRLRPAFCTMGFVAAGGDPDRAPGAEHVDDAGAAFELLHAFALVHDDVMDGADTRRSLPCPHARFRDHHVRAGGRGESRRFGESVAILVGDLAHVYADRLARRLPPAAQQVWYEMQVELMMGQYLDVLRTAQGRATHAQARRIAQLKSGRYTIARPLEMGATVAGATPDVLATLHAYAEPLGLAFQMRDDVLGAVGDPDLTGKPVGGDLREGKPTPLLALALEQADRAERRLLDRAGDPDLTDDDVGAMQRALHRTGALMRTEAEIDALTEQAIAEVRRADGTVLAPDVAQALIDLAHFVAGREV